MTDYFAIFAKRGRALAAMMAVAIGATAVTAVHNAVAVEMSPAAKAVVDYDKSGDKPTKKYRIAYLTECVDNPYCLARLAGLKAAAAIDIRRRPASEIRGPKWAWLAALVVNSAGVIPISYFVFGRRRPGT